MAIQFSILDYGIMAVLLVSVITGFSRGFVRELFAIGIWGISIWVASKYSVVLANYLKPWIAQEQIRSILGFIGLVAVFLILGGLVVSTLSFIIHKSGLSGTDRLLGMVFGILRAVFVVALVVVVMDYSGIKIKDYEKESKLYPQFKPVVAWVESMVPVWMNKIKGIDGSNHDLAMTTEVKPVLALNEFNHLQY
jgi:membrane protein required for colicin V production